jgi:cyclase
MGTVEHFTSVVKEGHADAVAMADVLHYKRLSIAQIRSSARQAGIPSREI